MASNFFPSHLHDSEEEDDPSHDAEEESDSVDGGDEDEDEEEHEEDPMNPSRPRHLYYAPLRVTPMASNFSPSPFHGSEEEDDPSHDAEEESDSVDGGDEEEDEEEHEEDEDEEEYEEEEEDEEEDEEDEDEEDEGEDEDFGLSVNSDEPATLPAESIGYPLEVASRVDQEEGFLEIPAILNDDGARGGRGEEEGEGGGEEERGDVEMVDVECCDKKDDGGVLQSSDGVELDRSMLPTCLICFEPWTSEGAHRICCIPCGHVYGRSCLEKWARKCPRNSGKCPQCNRRFRKKEIINLYAPLLIARDNELEEELHSLRTKNELEKNLPSLSDLYQEFHAFKDEVQTFQKRYQAEMDYMREQLAALRAHESSCALPPPDHQNDPPHGDDLA